MPALMRQYNVVVLEGEPGAVAARDDNCGGAMDKGPDGREDGVVGGGGGG
jgi:hypothetical protein